MKQFVISDGAAIRLSRVIAITTDEYDRWIAFLEGGAWIAISEEMHQKILAAIWNVKEGR